MVGHHHSLKNLRILLHHLDCLGVQSSKQYPIVTEEKKDVQVCMVYNNSIDILTDVWIKVPIIILAMPYIHHSGVSVYYRNNAR